MAYTRTVPRPDDGSSLVAIPGMATAANQIILMNDTGLIRSVTDAIPTLTEDGGTVTTDGLEQDVYINNAPAGIYKPNVVKIDLSNNGAGETVVIRTYFRNVVGGALVLEDTVTVIGVPATPMLNVPLDPTRFGTRVSIHRTAGVARDYVWEAIYEE